MIESDRYSKTLLYNIVKINNGCHRKTEVMLTTVAIETMVAMETNYGCHENRGRRRNYIWSPRNLVMITMETDHGRQGNNGCHRN